jgi:hypothetical protein
MMEWFNRSEAALWFGLAGVLAIRAAARRRVSCGGVLACAALVAFGASDLVEARTGAWWRPPWLAVWNAGCVLALSAALWLVKRGASSHRRRPRRERGIGMRRINAWLLIGIIGTAVFGSQFAVHYGRAVWGRSDIWWTPFSMALPLGQTEKTFQILFRDKPLASHLDRSALVLYSADGSKIVLKPDDVAVRLNNWHRIRSQFFHLAVFTAFAFGISLALLLVGVIGFRADRASDASAREAPST